MKLYYFPGSCALAPHVVLEWLGAEFEAARIQKGDPGYLEINPLGVVPALEHEGRLYTQADAILHWLAESFPDAKLGGDGSPDSNYALNTWMAFLTGDLHPAFFPFFNAGRYTTSVDETQLAAVTAALVATLRMPLMVAAAMITTEMLVRTRTATLTGTMTATIQTRCRT